MVCPNDFASKVWCHEGDHRFVTLIFRSSRSQFWVLSESFEVPMEFSFLHICSLRFERHFQQNLYVHFFCLFVWKWVLYFLKLMQTGTICVIAPTYQLSFPPLMEEIRWSPPHLGGDQLPASGLSLGPQVMQNFRHQRHHLPGWSCPWCGP